MEDFGDLDDNPVLGEDKFLSDTRVTYSIEPEPLHVNLSGDNNADQGGGALEKTRKAGENLC